MKEETFVISLFIVWIIAVVICFIYFNISSVYKTKVKKEPSITRFFLIIYELRVANIAGAHILSTNGEYANAYQACKTIAESVNAPDQFNRVMILNVIELSERDAYTWIKDQEMINKKTNVENGSHLSLVPPPK